MKTLIAMLLISISVYAQEPVTTINVKETNLSISKPGDILSVEPTIVKVDEANWGIKVNVSFQIPFQKPIYNEAFRFHLDNATVIQRDKELYLIYEGQEILIARHKWWYSPYWALDKHVRIITNFKWVGRKTFSLNPQLLIFTEVIKVD